jgi:hypothetical protein
VPPELFCGGNGIHYIYTLKRKHPIMIDDFVSNVKGFIMTPSETFRKTSGKSFSAAYQYYAVLLVIFTVLFGIVAVSMGLAVFTSVVDKMAVVPVVGGVAASAAANFSGFVIALGVFFVYLLFLFYLLGVFVEGLIIHAFVVLMGGEKGAKQTIKTTMYASTPFLLLGWIPIVSTIAYIWSFALLIIGIKETQEMELGNAILVVIIPVVLFIVLIGLGAAVNIAFMNSISSLVPKTF